MLLSVDPRVVESYMLVSRFLYPSSSFPVATVAAPHRYVVGPRHTRSLQSSMGSGQQAARQQKWVPRLGAVVLGLSMLVTLPWEKLDHEFAYSNATLPDTGPQDKDRCVCAAWSSMEPICCNSHWAHDACAKSSRCMRGHAMHNHGLHAYVYPRCLLARPVSPAWPLR